MKSITADEPVVIAGRVVGEGSPTPDGFVPKNTVLVIMTLALSSAQASGWRQVGNPSNSRTELLQWMKGEMVEDFGPEWARGVILFFSAEPDNLTT